MKVLIISDTHRRHENLEIVLEKEKPLDLLIHLGDAEGSEDYIGAIAECPMEIVSGNSDFFSTLPAELILELGKHRALVTHGHYYSVNTGMEDIKKEAEGRGCDMVMFGHTHRPFVDVPKLAQGKKKVITMNPGSLSYPRQEGKCPSYIVMQIDRNGEAHMEIKYL